MPRELHKARMGEIEMLRKQLDRAEVQLQASTKRYLEAESEVRDRDLRERALRLRADALESRAEAAESKALHLEQVVLEVKVRDAGLVDLAEEAATEALAVAAALDEKALEAVSMAESISADERTVASFWEEK